MFLITAAGRDRPGMAHALAQALFEAGCNLDDTTMTRLAGEFAMILIVSPPPELSLDELERRLSPLRDSHGMHISVRTIEGDEAAPQDGAASFIVTAYGPDNAGLLARMAEAFAGLGATLTDVQTRLASNGVYVMLFEIEAPPEVEEAALRASVEEAAREIGVSATVRPMEEEVL